MNAEELWEEWTDGEENGMRPQRVQQVREDLQEVIGLPIPERVHEIESWLEAMHGAGVITRKLEGAATEGDAEGSDDDAEDSDAS
jgi:hypothetical protein